MLFIPPSTATSPRSECPAELLQEKCQCLNGLDHQTMGKFAFRGCKPPRLVSCASPPSATRRIARVMATLQHSF